MFNRLFMVRDLRSAVRKTLLWSLIIAFIAVIASRVMYHSFFPEIAAEYGARLQVFSFALTLAIATPFVGLFLLVSLRLSAFNAQLQEMARRDSLTGLLNRAALEDIIDERDSEHRPDHLDDDAFILIDIDHFKTINDTHGHAAGDHVLRSVAVSIVGNVFERDHVARVGGEEFAVLLIEAGPYGAIDAAERIRSALQDNKTYFEGAAIRVTASIGGALFPKGASYEMTYRGADFALYRAKRGGRNRCDFNGLPTASDAPQRLAAEGGTDAA
ncbi:GGDEF domain-containing protein [Oricola sp.]|uniref:GGDEF domain-containing protein n=1 Tax=Oricola sp. TaxID=1979950 RepID=UPI0025FD92A4|nr:GGDEF domain-containing protein [Oricola sp.]MCI5076241.1 diguanylate cyclase [Oricola sp.]